MSSNITLNLSIENMMCEDGCARRVERMLRSMTGVAASTVDFSRREATLQVDADSFNESMALKTLAEAGFPASVIARSSTTPL